MTTININKLLLEQALNALLLPCDRWNKQQFLIVKGAIEALNAALAAPATAPAQPERKPMGQFEIEAAYQESQQHHLRPQDFNKVCDMVRAVEAFHGIKETP